jgi:hypothetical protein
MMHKAMMPMPKEVKHLPTEVIKTMPAERREKVKTFVSPPVPKAKFMAKPELSENDLRCYSSRYSDVNRANPLQHYMSIGVEQGRLGTCARVLTDYEAQEYLNSFPELQAKFGRTGPKALDAARDHFETVGYASTHFNAPMKDTSLKAWKCGAAPNTECKCHGVLHLGLAKRPDTKKHIKTWDEFRLFKTVSKSNSDYSLCNASDFGSDPHPGHSQECWCEDKPLYQPNYCADEGNDCLCNGYVLFGSKTNKKTGKPNTFNELIAGRFAVSEVTQGTSVSCDSESFGGATLKGDTVCMCDSEKKFFDAAQIKTIQNFWKADLAIKENMSEITGTETLSKELETELETRTTEFVKEIEIQEIEKEATLRTIETSKDCIRKAKEAGRTFKETQIRKKYLQRKRQIEISR